MIHITYLNYDIKLGRNSKENYELVMTSNPSDIWVHLSDYPSGHAIITNPLAKRVPIKVLKKACILVKQYSKYKRESKLVCDIAYVKDIEMDKNSGVDVKKLIKIILI